jgi:N-acetylglucosamine-6-sulfatase
MRMCSGACAIAFMTLAMTLPVEAEAPASRAACRAIVAACKGAGFVQGAAASGAGLQVDCVRPIMSGVSPPNGARMALPAVDPAVAAACKAANPAFGGQPAAAAAQAAATPVAALPPLPSLPEGTKRPNFVFVLTDDLALNLLPFMPNVQKMQKDGATFANYFVTDSLCCPSRTSIFTGRFPHNTGVFRNTGPDGGYNSFLSHGNDGTTYAVSLASAGYRTAMLGKYLNGYEPAQNPPGSSWTNWAVAGNGYRNFDYQLNEDGKLTTHGEQPNDYMTDILSEIAQRLIFDSEDKPFAIEIATFAPHAPYVPAPRDSHSFPDLNAPRTPAFNVAPTADAPRWTRELKPLALDDISRIDVAFRKRAQSVLAIDKMVGDLRATVAAAGQSANTYFIFSSDNGYHMGEHRMMPGKMTAYDSDIHVPLIISGPGVTAGKVINEIAENVDIFPTLAELAYAPTPSNIDGRSLAPLLRGQPVEHWRSLALIEHHGPLREPLDPDMPAARSGNPPTYEALRTTDAVYVEYQSGEREYHDIAADPDELLNRFPSLADATKEALHKALLTASACHGPESCHAADSMAPPASR